jgi:choice-of-anchor B domain-containing protein
MVMLKRPLRTALLSLFVVPALSPAPASGQEPNFGRAVAMTGDELVVGQPVNWYGPGVVYAYRLGTDGDWARQAALTAPDSSRMDDFGRALAIDGNTLVVGAPRKRDGSGVVYAFRRAADDGDWQPAGVIEPPRADDHREYGAALAVSGDDVLVGSPEAGSTGLVYHFTRSGDTWALAHVIAPGEGEAGDGFGESLSWSGDDLLVGAPRADSTRGRVYAVRRAADGGWAPPTAVELPRASLSPRSAVGFAVVVADLRAYAGAPGSDVVFALERQADGAWTVVGEIRPSDGAERAGFGAAVAASDAEVWVGAPGLNRGTGGVYRFTADDPGAWTQADRFEPADDTSWPPRYGYAVAMSAAGAVVGMPSSDFGEGRAAVLSRSATGWEASQVLEGTIFRIGTALETGARCEEGSMAEFPCTNMELVAHVPLDDLGGERGAWVNDVWGWTDPETNRDYALVARRDGSSFLDVSNPAAPRLLGNLPRTEGSRPSVWRDIKVLGNTAYIVADGAGAHGMQVFDLTRLRAIDGPAQEFEADTTYRNMASAHNVVADTETGFLYIVGSNSGGETCGGGLHIVDAREPLNPTFAGCYNDTASPGSRGYTHDAQCLVYRGPDEDYRGRELCIGSNESEINIADVTDKASPTTVSRMSYPDVTYAHQGWFDDEQRYFYMNDEGDEVAGVVSGTRTIVWDLTDLDDPVVANQYIGPVRATDHNLFVVGNRMFQSNYGSGLRVIDISDRENPQEIAFFDSAPYNDNDPGTSASQSGAWSNYPFFSSGLVIFTSVREGLFIMRVLPPIT